MTNIVVVDDEARVRSALWLLLQHEENVQVVGEAGDMDRALTLVDEERPDVIVLDWSMLDGTAEDQTMATLRTIRPHLGVIAISGRPELRAAAQAAGADIFVSKHDAPAKLRAAVTQCVQCHRAPACETCLQTDGE